MQQHTDIAVTPVITAAAYTADQQLGTLMTLPGVNVGGSEGTFLQKLVITDKANQNAAIDILFFNDTPTITSTDHATLAITAAEMARCCIGVAKVVAGDYSSVGTSNSVALRTGAPYPLALKPAKTNGTVYAVAISRGTPTYTSTSDLTFKFQVSWE